MPRRSTAAALLLALIFTVFAPGCTKTDGGARAGSSEHQSAPPLLSWTVDGVENNGTQPPGEDVIASVKTTLDAYLAHAVATPLYTGRPAGDLRAVFSAAALDRLAADPAARLTLVDEGLPPATRAITAEVLRASLSTVAGGDGATGLVAARLDLKLRAAGPLLDVDIVRQGEVVLSPEPEGWRIDSFLLRAERNSRDATAPAEAP